MLTNYGTSEENEFLINEVGNYVTEIKAKDSRRDAQTGACVALVNPNAPLSDCTESEVYHWGFLQ